MLRRCSGPNYREMSSVSCGVNFAIQIIVGLVKTHSSYVCTVILANVKRSRIFVRP